MKSVRVLATAVAALTVAASVARANTYYVAASGGTDGTGGGTFATPFATIAKAVSTAVDGDTIYLRGGTYAIKESEIAQRKGIYAYVIPLDKSGEDGGAGAQ